MKNKQEILMGLKCHITSWETADTEGCRFCPYINEKDCTSILIKDAIEHIESTPIVSKEAVEHPSHYNREGGMECWDEMEMIFGKPETAVFCKLSAWKYRYRSSDKNGEEDIRKSDKCLQKYKELTAGSPVRDTEW